ncbi:MAG: FGGY-family carbohydrate kinase [Thermoprotei archaeon]|nr:FGGY-family carbohydrate kinase [Thermoprotei archaeon]
MTEYLIGVDIGTYGTKAVLVDISGKVIGTSYIEYGVLTPKPGWAEQWPEVWFNATVKTIREVLEKTKVNPKDIAGVAISGLYGGSGIPCDREMKPLRPAIIWMDRRATKECAWVRENIGEEEIFKVSGNTIDPYFGYTKILWIKFNEPDIWRRIYKIVTPKDYVIYRLTGEIVIDYSSAGNYGGIFNIHKRTWSDKMLDEMGIPRDYLPDRIVMAKDVVGEITEDGAKLTGLRKGTPVCAGGIDAPVSALSVGAIEDGEIGAMLGTSMCIGIIQDKERLTPKLVNFPYVVDDTKKLYSFAGITTAGACIRYFRDTFGRVEKILSEHTNISAYAILDMEAEKVPPGCNGLIFLPHMSVGERAPWWDEELRSCLIGLTTYHTKAHVYRAMLEGIGYAIRYSLEVAMRVGIPIKRIMLVNGGARSPLWRRIIASITGMDMFYIAESPGAPYGDALLAGVGTGVLKGYETIKEWVKISEVTKPDQYMREVYNEYYKVYLKVYEANKEVFKLLTELTKKYS